MGVLKLWVLHSPSGICLYEQSFSDLPVDKEPFVTSGFLFGISKLAKHISEENIENIQLKTMQFSYRILDKNLFVMLTKKEMKQSRIDKVLDEIQDRFLSDYRKVLGEDFTGDVSCFQSFATEVEKILNTNTKYIQFIDRRHKTLEEYLQSKPREWISLKNKMQEKAKIFGKWVTRKVNPVDQELTEKIQETRSQAKKKKKKDKNYSGRFV
jgi:hypothetical protein